MDLRIRGIRRELIERGIFGMLITSYENYRYFSGFTGSNCSLIVTEKDAFLLTDGRYTQQAKLQAPNFTVISKQGAMPQLINEVLSSYPSPSIGYETMKVSDHTISRLKELCPDVNWVPIPDFALSTRSVKDEEEIKNIKTAVKIADDALSALIPEIKVGMTEREICARLEYNMARLGSEKPAFDTIVASGVRSSMPHGAPTNKKVELGDLITIDFGACCGGYMSDITRTLWLGEPTEELKKIYAAVRKVQRDCVKMVAPGVKCADIDAFQRAEFEKMGLSQYICHSLGHGVGLEIHEAPTLSRLSEDVLAPGMVVTVEPGLYLPNCGGVRIEDTVLVTQSGCEVLTQSKHDIKI